MSKILIAFLILLFLFSCRNSNQNTHKNIENKNDTLASGNKNVTKQLIQTKESFNLLNFRKQLDSLLSKFEHKKLKLNWDSDTISSKSNNYILSYFQKGIFINLLKPERFDTIIMNHFYDPSTRKVLRIYLIEAFYSDSTKSKSLFQKIYKQKNNKIEMIEDDGPESYYINYGLTGLYDFVVRKGKIIYWINASSQYSKVNFNKIINIFKSNLNDNIIQDSIKCNYNQGCE